MIEGFDDRVRSWILGVAAGKEVSFAAPGAPKPGSGVGAYLLEVMKSAPSSTTQRPLPLELTLRYVITTWSDKPEDGHELLVRLMFAAMGSTEYEVESEALPIAVWTALGIPPRPSFILRARVVYERTAPDVKLVRQPLKMKASPMTSLHGLVLGPGDIPLANCQVEIPAMSLSASTDYNGRFVFSAVPGDGTKRLVVRAKGKELAVACDKNYPDISTPIVIHFSLLEA